MITTRLACFTRGIPPSKVVGRTRGLSSRCGERFKPLAAGMEASGLMDGRYRLLMQEQDLSGFQPMLSSAPQTVGNRSAEVQPAGSDGERASAGGAACGGQRFAERRSTIFEEEWPGTSGTMATVPPARSTTSLPTTWSGV